MPTIRIEGLSDDGYDINHLLTRCAEAAASALDIPKDWVWALFRTVEPGCYVEGENAWQGSEVKQATLLVSIVALEGRSAELKASLLEAVATTVSEVTGVILEKVFVEYRDIPKGLAFSGGMVV